MALTSEQPDCIVVGEDRTHIRIRNLWLLYLWASDLYQHLDVGERASAELNVDELPSLAAEILSIEAGRRLRRRPTLQYVELHAALPAVRGRIDHLGTARDWSLQRGRVACIFEELSMNTPRNRYVLAALDMAGRNLGPQYARLRQECLSTAAHLERQGVALARPDRGTPRRETFGHHDRGDRRMVAAAQLVVDLLIPSRSPGSLKLSRPPEGDQQLRRVFEKALRNFLALSLSHCRVSSRRLLWPVDNPSAAPLFPSMQTDITIDHPDGTRLVIDTKFTNATRLGQYSSVTFREGHLYQLYAYLRTQERENDPASQTAAGMLLYPQTEASGHLDVVTGLQGHTIRVATLDLMASSDEIRDRLRYLAGG